MYWARALTAINANSALAHSTLDMRWLCTALEDVVTAATLAFSRLRALL